SESWAMWLHGGLTLWLLLGLIALPAIAQQPPTQELPPPTPLQTVVPPQAPADALASEGADVTRFRMRVEAALNEPRAAKGHWGLLVVDGETGATVFEWGADQYFTPASNTKLYTTALAMATLGPDYRFRTTIETNGAVDAQGRLIGDLVLVGRGDPNLSPRKLPYDREVETDGAAEKILAQLADQVVARGVSQIEGDVVADDSFFPYERYPSGWAIDDMLWRYGAPVSALAVNDSVVTIELRPALKVGAPVWMGVEPWANFYELRGAVMTGTAGSARQLRVQREPGSHVIDINGTLPLGYPPEKINIAIEEPAEHAAALLRRLLEARGVRIYGTTRAQHRSLPPPGMLAPMMTEVAAAPGGGAVDGAVEPAAVLAEHFSLPLIESVTVINKVSQNLHTEMLLRTASRETTGDGGTEAALQMAEEFQESIGIAEGDVRLHDGSGLSRRNLVTPRATATLLRWAAAQPWGEAFRASLPVAGLDGTLEDRMKDTSAAGRVWAKTGTLDNVNSLAGYAETLSGRRLIFAIYGNLHNLRGRRPASVIDAVCVAMVEEIGRSENLTSLPQ
ncbi:MAG: D-alanyl-D-alanine carboxypeptidase/D-alanyl-D-alanine endopeptidase, partial [Candidatus Acidiferrales bacterium]